MQAAEKKNPGLAKLLQGDDAKAVEALAPWVSFEETFQRPNQQEPLYPIPNPRSDTLHTPAGHGG